MKKITLLASLFLFPCVGFAQQQQQQDDDDEILISSTRDSVVTTEIVNPSKYTVETNTFGHNWFLSLGIGGQMYFGDHTKQMKFLDRPSLYGEFDAGKWFTPGLGIRLNVGGGVSNGVSGWTGNSIAYPGENVNNYKGYIVYGNNDTPVIYSYLGGNKYYPLYKTSIQWMNVGFDALFNISNMIWGYNTNRFYSFIPYGGVGFAFSLNKAYNYVGRIKSGPDDWGESRVVSASLGLLNKFKVSDNWDIDLDIRGVYVGETFDHQFGGYRGGNNPNNYVDLLGRGYGEGILTAKVGITYNILPEWDKAVRTTIRVNENVLAELNSRLAKSQDQNNTLREQLDEALNREVTKENVISQPLLVTFTIDRWNLSKKDRVNLGFLAEAIKANPNVVYVVTGYADKGTGSVSRNIFLSQKRAEVVRNCLVNEFEVDENQLIIKSDGGVGNMFYNDPRLSRAVLTQAISK